MAVVRGGRAVPVARSLANRSSRPSASAQSAEAAQAVTVSNIDRLVSAGLYHLAPEVLDAVKILKPETVIDGIAPASTRGAGNQDRAAVDQGHLMRFANSFVERGEPAMGRSTHPRRTP